MLAGRDGCLEMIGAEVRRCGKDDYINTRVNNLLVCIEPRKALLFSYLHSVLCETLTAGSNPVGKYIAKLLDTKIPPPPTRKKLHYLYDGGRERTYSASSVRKLYYQLKKVVEWHARKHDYILPPNLFSGHDIPEAWGGLRDRRLEAGEEEELYQSARLGQSLAEESVCIIGFALETADDVGAPREGRTANTTTNTTAANTGTLVRELTATAIGLFVVLAAILFTNLVLRLLAQAAGGGVAPDGILALLGFAALVRVNILLAVALFLVGWVVGLRHEVWREHRRPGEAPALPVVPQRGVEHPQGAGGLFDAHQGLGIGDAQAIDIAKASTAPGQAGLDLAGEDEIAVDHLVVHLQDLFLVGQGSGGFSITRSPW